ncbi:Transglycosylase SLT domain-containing protein (plasmid) [Beijerinckiaceae bacterium RH AL1]|nr:Transglycosylase SLT domain-containing protein [Beijerinckiaceae bacterium RH CH11]VVB50331.1 Transglycosylase SLT domain-containing protein [Beijerinckiaceae bacterium RH AL8]VVC57349.1 Transglycosylase SLT domain-containing protein [Beijerinckiaceae bacterium RH AL1]
MRVSRATIGLGLLTAVAATAAQAAQTYGDPSKAATCSAAAASLPADQARALVLRIATEESFYPEFVLSVAKIESHYVSSARSPKGAYGLMQLTPDTAQRFKVDLCAPADNVRGGIRYLRFLHDRYKNPFFILAAYNAGEKAVLESRGVPPYPETVRFIADVMNDFYTWPVTWQVARQNSVRAGAGKTFPAVTPNIIEIAPAPQSGSPAKPEPKPAPHDPWSDGFVMHVEQKGEN